MFPIQVRFSFIRESIAEMGLFSISSKPVSYVHFLNMLSKYQRRTLALIISGDIHDPGGLIFFN